MTLGLTPNASQDHAREAYRDLVQVWHPDRFVHNERLRSQAEAKLSDINSSYEVLEAYFSGEWRLPLEDSNQTFFHTIIRSWLRVARHGSNYLDFKQFFNSINKNPLKKVGVAFFFLLPGIIISPIIVFKFLEFPILDFSFFPDLERLNALEVLEDGADESSINREKFAICKNADGTIARNSDGRIVVINLEKERKIPDDIKRAETEVKRGRFFFYMILAFFIALGWRIYDWISIHFAKRWLLRVAKLGYSMLVFMIVFVYSYRLEYYLLALLAGYVLGHLMLQEKEQGSGVDPNFGT
jgi:hypothetical protein